MLHFSVTDRLFPVRLRVHFSHIPSYRSIDHEGDCFQLTRSSIKMSGTHAPLGSCQCDYMIRAAREVRGEMPRPHGGGGAGGGDR